MFSVIRQGRLLRVGKVWFWAMAQGPESVQRCTEQPLTSPGT